MPRNIFQVTVNLPASFRNNINNNEVFNPYVFVRNRLYHFVFHRFALLYARLFSDVQRKLIEFLILLASLFCFITLVYVHVVFVQTPMTCLDGYKDVWQRNGILRVEVLSGKKKENYSVEDSYWKEKTLRLQHFDGQSYYFYTEQAVKEENAEKMDEVVDVGRNVSEAKIDILDDAVFEKTSYVLDADEFKESEGEVDVLNGSEFDKGLQDENFQPVLDESILSADPEGAYIMEFSLEYGFLRLRPSKRRDLNISVTFVVLDPEVDQCFGGSFNRFLLDNFLGYDNVLLASIKKMAEKKDQKGFVRNAVMDIEYIFINNWVNEKSYITAGFVMVIFTLTISTLLRHSHHQIFIVVVWPRNLIPSSGAPVLTVILALVGMEAVMSDFFHDRSIALHVIVIVWFADLYDAVCCQSALSKRHWFRFFYLYHFLFYAYNYKFGGVYWPLTLMTSWLFTLHSMVFFFHHYELPRFLHRAARMSAAHQAANNARPPNNPPDDTPPENNDAPAEPNPDQPEQDQDDVSANHTLDVDEPTAETEEDQPNRDDQPNSVDQPVEDILVTNALATTLDEGLHVNLSDCLEKRAILDAGSFQINRAVPTHDDPVPQKLKSTQLQTVGLRLTIASAELQRHEFCSVAHKALDSLQGPASLDWGKSHPMVQSLQAKSFKQCCVGNDKFPTMAVLPKESPSLRSSLECKTTAVPFSSAEQSFYANVVSVN